MQGSKASACISCDVSCKYCVTALISEVQCCCLEGVVRADVYPHQVWSASCKLCCQSSLHWTSPLLNLPVDACMIVETGCRGGLVCHAWRLCTSKPSPAGTFGPLITCTVAHSLHRLLAGASGPTSRCAGLKRNFAADPSSMLRQQHHSPCQFRRKWSHLPSHAAAARPCP